MAPAPVPYRASTERPWVVIGAGGHGRVVADLLLAAGAEVRGFADPGHAPGTVLLSGLPVLGGDDALGAPGLGPDAIWLANGIGSLPGRNSARRDLFLRLQADGYRFPPLVHPTAIIARDVALADGVQVMAGAIIQTGASVGTGSIINTGARIDHDGRIGAHVHVAPGVVLSGSVSVGDGAHLGTASAAIQGISIGADAVVGAGAVALRPVPAAGVLRPAPPVLSD